MPHERRYVIVSPHPDDAAFSCGALMTAQGSRIRVVTVCGGLPPEGVEASDWDQRCGFATARDAATVRMVEDQRACASVGAEVVVLSRYDRPYTDGEADADGLAEVLRPLLAGMHVLLPAAIGGHPDHVMARDAALRVLRSLRLPATLYGDVPYASAGGWTRVEAQRDPRLHWRPALDEVAAAGFTLSPARWRRLDPAEAVPKIALARHYASQLCGLGAHHPRLMHVRGDLATEVSWQIVPTREA